LNQINDSDHSISFYDDDRIQHFLMKYYAPIDESKFHTLCEELPIVRFIALPEENQQINNDQKIAMALKLERN
jgi:hypothetical protein